MIVRDVARTETGQLAPLIFKRVQLPPDLVLPIVFGCRCKLIPCICESPSPKSVPPRLIIQSPPPAANVDLDLNLDHFVDVNHSGVVYASSLSTDSRKISQFAIKFAGCNRNKNLLREAWFYDELQSLQGASVPRCYGYFHAILPAKWTIVPWQDHGNEINDAELTDESFKLLGEFNMSYRPVLARFERGQCLGLMLLECLGEPFLKERSGAPIPDGIIQSIYKAYADLGFLGIEHGSVRPPNILRVIPNANQPSLTSPFSDLTHDFRLVDFESARKTNGTIMATGLTHASLLETMLDELQT